MPNRLGSQIQWANERNQPQATLKKMLDMRKGSDALLKTDARHACDATAARSKAR